MNKIFKQALYICTMFLILLITIRYMSFEVIPNDINYTVISYEEINITNPDEFEEFLLDNEINLYVLSDADFYMNTTNEDAIRKNPNKKQDDAITYLQTTDEWYAIYLGYTGDDLEGVTEGFEYYLNTSVDINSDPSLMVGVNASKIAIIFISFYLLIVLLLLLVVNGLEILKNRKLCGYLLVNGYDNLEVAKVVHKLFLGNYLVILLIALIIGMVFIGINQYLIIYLFVLLLLIILIEILSFLILWLNIKYQNKGLINKYRLDSYQYKSLNKISVILKVIAIPLAILMIITIFSKLLLLPTTTTLVNYSEINETIGTEYVIVDSFSYDYQNYIEGAPSGNDVIYFKYEEDFLNNYELLSVSCAYFEYNQLIIEDTFDCYDENVYYLIPEMYLEDEEFEYILKEYKNVDVDNPDNEVIIIPDGQTFSIYFGTNDIANDPLIKVNANTSSTYIIPYKLDSAQQTVNEVNEGLSPPNTFRGYDQESFKAKGRRENLSVILSKSVLLFVFLVIAVITIIIRSYNYYNDKLKEQQSKIINGYGFILRNKRYLLTLFLEYIIIYILTMFFAKQVYISPIVVNIIFILFIVLEVVIIKVIEQKIIIKKIKE